VIPHVFHGRDGGRDGRDGRGGSFGGSYSSSDLGANLRNINWQEARILDDPGPWLTWLNGSFG